MYHAPSMDTDDFSKWTPWSERLGIPGSQHPGVYLMAHFPNPPTGPADPLGSEIVYIGETCRSLRRRWRSFARAISEGKKGHSGGLTYYAAYCQQPGQESAGNLYVAALPVTLEEPRRSAYIRHLERS